MSHSEEDRKQTDVRAALGPHLPFLRRHARALAGSQRGGDQHVRAALEAVVAAPELLLPDGSPRITLFRLFHRYWATVHANDKASALAGPEALLLTAVEGFGIGEAAVILQQNPDVVETAMNVARRAIAAQIRSRVLVIEDEPVIAMHIEQIIEDMGHEIVASAMTHKEAVAEALRVRPDLVLADIQLADGSSGIDAVAEILDTLDVPVVFITAYPERLLTGDGQQREPTFLVTKPFEEDNVVATVGHALLARRAFQTTE